MDDDPLDDDGVGDAKIPFGWCGGFVVAELRSGIDGRREFVADVDRTAEDELRLVLLIPDDGPGPGSELDSDPDPNPDVAPLESGMMALVRSKLVVAGIETLGSACVKVARRAETCDEERRFEEEEEDCNSSGISGEETTVADTDSDE